MNIIGQNTLFSLHFIHKYINFDDHSNTMQEWLMASVMARFCALRYCMMQDSLGHYKRGLYMPLVMQLEKPYRRLMENLKKVLSVG